MGTGPIPKTHWHPFGTGLFGCFFNNFKIQILSRGPLLNRHGTSSRWIPILDFNLNFIFFFFTIFFSYYYGHDHSNRNNWIKPIQISKI